MVDKILETSTYPQTKCKTFLIISKKLQFSFNTQILGYKFWIMLFRQDGKFFLRISVKVRLPCSFVLRTKLYRNSKFCCQFYNPEQFQRRTTSSESCSHQQTQPGVGVYPEARMASQLAIVHSRDCAIVSYKSSHLRKQHGDPSSTLRRSFRFFRRADDPIQNQKSQVDHVF